MERRPSYEDLDADALYALLAIHRKNLGILEQQAAQFTFVHVPIHIIHSIEEQKKAIDSIKEMLDSRQKGHQSDMSRVTSAVNQAIDQIDSNTRTLHAFNQARSNVTTALLGISVLVFFAFIYNSNIDNNGPIEDLQRRVEEELIRRISGEITQEIANPHIGTIVILVLFIVALLFFLTRLLRGLYSFLYAYRKP